MAEKQLGPVEQAQRRAALQPVFTLAAVRSERTFAVARICIVALVLPLLLKFKTGGAGFGKPAIWLALSGCLLALAWSAWTLVALRPDRTVVRHLRLSVTVDAAVVGLALLPFLIWPTPSYQGFLRGPDVGICILVTIAAGFRLSRRSAILGAALMCGVQALALFSDLRLHPGRITYGVETIATWAVYSLGAATLAYALASWSRKLAYHSAKAALLAARARKRLNIYVSEEVGQESLEDAEVRLGGHRQQVAVLFSDLRGFTRYGETVAPEQLVNELNRYLGVMVRAIQDEGGVIDKYIGDAIMAVFGIRTSRPDDAARAIRAAAAMHRALIVHNAERHERGEAPLRQGVGVHCGNVVVGNIGTANRMQFTVIGDVVNLASRLEAATKAQRTPIVISAAAVDAARQSRSVATLPETRSLGSITVPGRLGTIEVFTLAPDAECDYSWPADLEDSRGGP